MQQQYRGQKMIPSGPVQIYNGDRGERFINFLKSFLKKGNLKDDAIKMLLTPDKESDYDPIKYYSSALTHPSADPVNNYEYYEFIGDAIANASIVWYFNDKFPQLRCQDGIPVMSRLKINYVSKQTFSGIAEKLGMWDLITASEEERQHKKKSLLEDSLEAMIGVTSIIIDRKVYQNIGFSVIRDIINNLYSQVPISLHYNDIFDSITRLKEIFDMKEYNQMIGTAPVKKLEEIENGQFKLQKISIYDGRGNLLGAGTASLKADAEKIASEQAIAYLNSRGIKKEPKDSFKKFCRFD